MPAPIGSLLLSFHCACRLVGFDELGGLDTFATEVLEKRLQKSGVIDGPTAALAAAASTGRR